MPFSALWTELKQKGSSVLELSTEKDFRIIHSEGRFGFCMENSICLYSNGFTPHFAPLLKILEGVSTLKSCSKGKYKLEITFL